MLEDVMEDPTDDESGRKGKAYIPSPAEIAAAMAEIRSTWSDREYRIRAGLAPDVPPVTVRTVNDIDS